LLWSAFSSCYVAALPKKLREALDALCRDHDCLLQIGVFDEGQMAGWIRVKYAVYYGVRTRPRSRSRDV
jgi:glutamine synthetase